MFLNIYRKRIICALRDWESLIWILIFPIMLSTLFYFAFSNLDEAIKLQDIPLGIIEDEQYQMTDTFDQVLTAVSTGEDALFIRTAYSCAADADTALKADEIAGYIRIIDDRPELVVHSSQLNQTIIKSFLDQYLQLEHSIVKMLAEHPEKLSTVMSLFDTTAYTTEVAATKNPPTETVNYFYALLAMICMYGGFQGLRSISYLQANLSALGARQTLSPTNRFKLVLSDLLGGITVQFGCILIVVAYITLVLKISFGSQFLPVLLTCLAGSLLGVSFGSLISVTPKMKDVAKTAVLIAVTMVLCFMSGLMVSGINYTIAEKAPMLAWLNPAARIADAFYCLYYYDTYDRYLLNIAVILGYSIIMFILTAFFVRRQRYESI